MSNDSFNIVLDDTNNNNTVPNTHSRAAIITGAARGIGRAVAIQLAEDGFDIALNDLPSTAEEIKDVVKIIEQKGRKAIAILGDVGKEDFVQELVDGTVAELGQLYVVSRHLRRLFSSSFSSSFSFFVSLLVL